MRNPFGFPSISAAVVVLGVLCPLFWASRVNLDWGKLTEEWYKTVANIVVIVFGSIVFTYIQERVTRERDLRSLRNWVHALSNQAVLVRGALEMVRGYLDGNCEMSGMNSDQFRVTAVYLRRLQGLAKEVSELDRRCSSHRAPSWRFSYDDYWHGDVDRLASALGVPTNIAFGNQQRDLLELLNSVSGSVEELERAEETFQDSLV